MGAPAIEVPGGQLVYSTSEAQVTRLSRGPASIFRFTGACNPQLTGWLAGTLRETKGPAVLSLRALVSIDAPFVQALLDHGRKRPVAFVDPPDRAIEILEEVSALDRTPVLSAEAALVASGSIPDSLAHDRVALGEIESRFRINPLWRRIDQEHAWICALCGMEVEDVRIRDAAKPGPVAIRRIRRHLLEDCMAWKAGRQAPLPASVLDSFLGEVNRRKASEDAERKRRLAEEIQSLQGRVESMQELERSMDQAKRRQLHLLPIDPAPDEVAEIAVHYRPLQAVSGDFLDFYGLDDNRFGVAIGDVSGHGVETAIVMGMAKMALRVRSQALGSVRDRVALANADLYSELRRSAFVTGVFAAIDRDTRRMSYVRAGHPRPILRRAAGGCEELDAPGLPFGVDGGKRFTAGLEEREVDLEPGDVVFLYTDGLIEAGPATAQFGPERVREALLAAPAELPAQAILAAVVASLDRYLAGEPLGDDLTAICLKIR
jgi:serine phosphatase RsbU (regulator of sigma subunit)